MKHQVGPPCTEARHPRRALPTLVLTFHHNLVSILLHVVPAPPPRGSTLASLAPTPYKLGLKTTPEEVLVRHHISWRHLS